MFGRRRTIQGFWEGDGLMKLVLCALLVVLASGTLMSPSLSAEVIHPVQFETLAREGGISMQKATAIVRQVTGGRVVSASPSKNGGFKVRVVLEGGRVKTYKVDRNGRIK